MPQGDLIYDVPIYNIYNSESQISSDAILDKFTTTPNQSLTTSLSLILSSLNNNFSSSNKPNIADVNGLQSALNTKFR
jgi:hypothetical protein